MQKATKLAPIDDALELDATAVASGSREPAAVVSMLAAAALSLMGAAGAAGPAQSAAIPMEEAHPRDAAEAPRAGPKRLSPLTQLPIDRTGRKRVGKASYYAHSFAGRKMADGTRMEPTGNNAASLTLPLGTTAKVTNLETGKAAVVTIRDRGPYIEGRIVDLSPATAEQDPGLGSTNRRDQSRGRADHRSAGQWRYQGG